MRASVSGVRRGRLALAAMFVAIALVAGNLVALVSSNVAISPAAADTAPVDPSRPETVSAAALPTVQINGVVWAQVIAGNRVYATGNFSSARPAGSAAGTNQTARSNILAYDITTGALVTSWAPTLNAQGMAITKSADGSVIYVGGDFDRVNNVTRQKIAAIDAQTGALLPGFTSSGANNRVASMAVNNNTLYVGGYFTTFGGQARSRLAAVNATTGALQSWSPATDREVVSMVAIPATGKIVVGGNFNTLNGATNLGMGAVDGTTGTNMPWPINTIIRNNEEGAEISGLATDGTSVFGTGWSYSPKGANANFEGVFSANAETGAFQWMNGGRGDNYSVATANGVVYNVGHPHDWGMLDWNPEMPTRSYQYAQAIDANPITTLTNAYGVGNNWNVPAGRPAGQNLHWMPTLELGTFTGQSQAGWSVAANGDYTVIGGEFPTVNGTRQQGLVRFARREISPTVDPVQGQSQLTPTITNVGPGSVRLAWTAAWDRDNERLKVEVLRGGVVIKTFNNDKATWWNRQPLGFVDDTAPPGTSQSYRIRMTDPFGNGITGNATSVTIPSGTPQASPYNDSVKVDDPAWQWRLGETSGTAARDFEGSNDLTLNSGVVRNAPGAILTDTNPSASFPGSTSTSTVQATTPFWQSGPQNFSLEAWVKTTTTTGGKIIGFGDSRSGRSTDDGNDRTLYMTNSGQIRFGVRPDMGTRQTINSPATYNDGEWHHVVGTLSSAGMKLFVDANVVASNPAVTKAQVYRGYWRVGGDNLGSWPSAPSREAINAQIDEVAVYPIALPAGRIEAHFTASGRVGPPPNVLPVASFTASSQDLTATLTSTSNDSDGIITQTTWDFGDGTSSTGTPILHNYSSAGTYPVTVTVTDNRGDTSTSTQNVTVTGTAPALVAGDLFGRTVVDDFGTADIGGPWNESGASTSFSVSGGAGADRGRRQPGPLGVPAHRAARHRRDGRRGAQPDRDRWRRIRVAARPASLEQHGLPLAPSLPGQRPARCVPRASGEQHRHDPVVDDGQRSEPDGG